ncbi:MAG: hypothetical protein ACYS29_18535, partial [Planctomycetota bacterium]
IVAIAQNLHELQKTVEVVQTNGQRAMARTAAIEKGQHNLQQTIENNVRQLAGNMESMARSLATLQQAVADVQSNSKQATVRFAVIERNQLNLQQQIEGNIQQLAGSVESIGRNLATLQQAVAEVQNNTQQTTARFAVIESNQLDLQQQIEDNIQQVLESLEAFEQQNEPVSPADSSEEAVSTEASVAAADIDAAEVDAVE